MKLFCFMLSGKPLTEHIREVLFENAHDMVLMEQTEQFIQRGNQYDGIIRTDGHIMDFCGVQVMHFEAELVYRPHGYTKVQYGVRLNDLDHISEASWQRGVAIRRE